MAILGTGSLIKYHVLTWLDLGGLLGLWLFGFPTHSIRKTKRLASTRGPTASWVLIQPYCVGVYFLFMNEYEILGFYSVGFEVGPEWGSYFELASGGCVSFVRTSRALNHPNRP